MEVICEIDKIISEFDSKDKKEMSSCRKKLRELIQEYANLEKNTKLTLPETIVFVAESDSKRKRNISMILLHALDSDYIFKASESDGKLLQILDKNIPDLYRRFEILERQQTHEKIKEIENIHGKLMGALNDILNIDECLHLILSSRQKIEKTLNDKSLNSYLSYLGFERIKKHIKGHFSCVSHFSEKPEVFYEQIPNLISDLDNELTYCKENDTFLTRTYKIYLSNLKKAVENERASSKDRFECT